MSNLKKTIIFALAGWGAFAFFSVRMYPQIIKQTCYFASSWLSCTQDLSPILKFFYISVFTLIILCIFLSGIYLWRAYKNEINISRKKIALIISGIIFLAFLTVPSTSGDIVFYFYSGKAVQQGINPYTQDWHLENNFIKPAIVGNNLGFGYGPLMARIFELFYSLSGEDLLMFIVLWKLFVVAVFSLCGWLVYKCLSQFNINYNISNFLLLWFLQPIALFEWVATGHFDVIWLCLLVVAIILTKNKKWFFVLPCLMVGVWLKFVPIFFIPWFAVKWWQEVNWQNWKKMIFAQVGSVATTVLITYISWFGLWQGFSVFKSIIRLSKWAAQSLFAAFYYSFVPLFKLFIGVDFHWYLTRFAQGSLLLFIVYLLWPVIKKTYLILLKRTSFSDIEFDIVIFLNLLVYMIIWQKSLWPWYFTWFLPLGIVIYIKNQNKFYENLLKWVTLSPLFYHVVWFADRLYLNGLQAGTELWFDYYMVSTIIAFPLYQVWKWRKNQYFLS